MTSSTQHNPRVCCATIIAHWLTSGDFPDRMLPENSDKRAFVQEVVYGTTRWKRRLEWILSTRVSRPPDPQAKAYLLVGLYQLFIMDHVPDHAAVHETVEAAKTELDPPRVRFINGVLRAVLRESDVITRKLDAQPLGVYTSHPDILISRWTRQLGRKTTEAVCHWDNRRPDITLHVNTHRIAFNAYVSQLAAAGIEASPHPADPTRFLTLPQAVPITALPGYAEGLFTIQDPATLLAVDLLKVRPGMRVLDACAAPGGKTFACAEYMQNDGQLLAIDRHKDRLARLTENADRMGFSCLRILQADASNKAGLAPLRQYAPFDRILLDVPCSNTGVLRRRPDARWRFSETRLRKLIGLQARLLNACRALLAPDGMLVYSTCSLEPEENHIGIENWLRQNTDFTLTAEATSIPPASGMDGAYAARLETCPHSELCDN